MKATLATIKAFIRREKKAGRLYIKVKSSFDGMIDCVREQNDEFTPAQYCEETENNLGIIGAWFVGRSRDHFTEYADDKFIGWNVWNCCGSFVLAFPRVGVTLKKGTDKAAALHNTRLLLD